MLALCGCGGGSTISKQRLSSLVLTRQALGSGYAPFSSGAQTPLDNQGTPRADSSRFGREGGWIIRLHRTAAPKAPGPLVVESRADLFGGSGGAGKDLSLYRQMFASTPGDDHRTLSASVGDESVADTFLQSGQRVRFFRIAWRYENATAAVTVEGFDGKLTKGDAVRLARKQQQRLVRAAR
jgi:hypothetical protein